MKNKIFFLISFLLIISLTAFSYNSDDFNDMVSYVIYPDIKLRDQAGWAKSVISKDTAAIDVLIDYLSSVNSRTLWEVKYLLIDLNKAAVPRLSERISDTVTTANILSIEILGEIGDSSVAETLYPLLKSKHQQLRNYTAIALGKLNDKRAVSKLLPLLDDPADMPRKSALVSIGKLADNETATLEAVFENLDDTYYYQRFSAVEAAQKFDTDLVMNIMFDKIFNNEFDAPKKLNLILRILSGFSISSEKYHDKIFEILNNSDNEIAAGYALKILKKSSVKRDIDYISVFKKRFPNPGNYNM